jgi:CubicO group peptidase (beta-lactamase class C family)
LIDTGDAPDTPHLLMSIQVHRWLGRRHPAEQGRLDTDAPITRYARHRRLRVRWCDWAVIWFYATGVAFSEAYQNPDAGVAIERRYGWRPDGGSMALACTPTWPSLGAPTDRMGVLGSPLSGYGHARVGARAGRRGPMADLVSSMIWAPMAPSTTPRSPVTVRRLAVHDGGISATARDLAKFG